MICAVLCCQAVFNSCVESLHAVLVWFCACTLLFTSLPLQLLSLCKAGNCAVEFHKENKFTEGQGVREVQCTKQTFEGFRSLEGLLCT